MKKNRSTLMLVMLSLVVAIGLPYYFSSQRATALDVKTKAAHDEERSFREKSLLGERIRKQSGDWKKSLDTLKAAMPANPDIQGAIRTLQTLTDVDVAPDHVRWISGSITGIATKAATPVATTIAGKKETPATVVVAADPSASAAPPSTGYDLSISVEGSRAKVLAFVTKIQQKPDLLPRLFAVKSVTLGQVQASAPTSPGSSPVTAAPATDSSVMVRAEIKLRVTGFGSVEATTGAQTPASAPIPAGPATTAGSTPVTSAPNP